MGGSIKVHLCLHFRKQKLNSLVPRRVSTLHLIFISPPDIAILNVNLQACEISNKALIYTEAQTLCVIAGGSEEKNDIRLLHWSVGNKIEITLQDIKTFLASWHFASTSGLCFSFFFFLPEVIEGLEPVCSQCFLPMSPQASSVTPGPQSN